jgi:type VI protein secretion system component VasK
MQRVLAATLAVLVAAVLLFGTAHYVGFFVPFIVRVSAHPGHSLAMRHAGSAIAMFVSMGSMYLCLWIALRQRPRKQESAPEKFRV